jgi:hypothetical protein
MRRSVVWLALVAVVSAGWVACSSYESASPDAADAAVESTPPPVPPPPPPPDGGDGGLPPGKTIANKRGSPSSLAMTADQVFWVESSNGTGSIVGASRKSDTEAIIIDNLASPTALTILAGRLTFAVTNGAGSIRSILLDGGDATLISSAPPPVDSIAYVAGGYYFPYKAGGVIEGCQSCAGSPTVLASAQGNPHALVGSGAELFWARDNGPPPVVETDVVSVSLVAVGGDAGIARALALDPANVYAAMDDDVMVVPRSGGDWKKLATVGKPWALAAFGGSVYAIAFDAGVLYKIPANGGAAVAIGGGLVQPTSLVVDGEDVYVASTGDGRVVRFDP